MHHPLKGSVPMPSTISSKCLQMRAKQAVRSRESFGKDAWMTSQGRSDSLLNADDARRWCRHASREGGHSPLFGARSTRQPRRVLHRSRHSCLQAADVEWTGLCLTNFYLSQGSCVANELTSGSLRKTLRCGCISGRRWRLRLRPSHRKPGSPCAIWLRRRGEHVRLGWEGPRATENMRRTCSRSTTCSGTELGHDVCIPLHRRHTHKSLGTGEPHHPPQAGHT